jgi:ABC-type glycerol-3-phosphate transport system substrate-binding protein
LQAKGFDSPWGVDPISQFTNLQNVVSWIWGAGGSILSADGKQPLFCEKDAIRGMQQYFELYKYLPAQLRQAEHLTTSPKTFLDREVAVAIWNPNWRTLNTQYAKTPDVLDRIGAAQPPGPAYVGGSNLILWSHSRYQADAVELVQKLTSKEVHEYLVDDGVLPARKDILLEPPYTTDPHLQVMVEALNTGRAYPNSRRWGLVEERLGMTFINIWGEVFENDGKDIDRILEHHLGTMCRRLETTLSEY